VDCSSAATVRADFKSIATLCGWYIDDADPFCGAKDQLANLDKSTLLILDNCDDPSTDFSRYIPNSLKVSVILTTRLSDAEKYASSDPYDVSANLSLQLDGLDAESAIEVFLKTSGVQGSDVRSSQQARHIAHALEYHPLALVIASSLVRSTTYSLEEYAEALTTRFTQSELLNTESEQATYRKVSATFEVSADTLKSLATTDPSAHNALALLDILGFLHDQGVSEDIFVRAWDYAEEVSSHSQNRDWPSDRLTSWHVVQSQYLHITGTSEEKRRALRRCRAHLVRLSLVSTDPTGCTISMHSLVHTWARERVQNPVEGWIAAASILSLSTMNEPSWQEFTSLTVKHLEACFAFREYSRTRPMAPSSVELCRIWHAFAWQMLCAHSRMTLELCQHFVKEMYSQNPGEDLFPNWQHLLGTALLESGQVTRAIEVLEKGVKRREKLADDHPSRLASEHQLASGYLANGQISRAIQILEHVVDVQRKLADDHPDRLGAQYEIARVYLADGQTSRAIEILEHIVKVQEKLAKDHPLRLGSRHQLALAYLASGRSREAAELLEDVVKVHERCLSEDHPSRLLSQQALAEAYLANGQVSHAVEVLEHVVTMQERFAKGHPDHLSSLEHLAIAYLANGQDRRAVPFFEQVVQERQNTLSEEHPHRLQSQKELARAYHVCGRTREAEVLMRRVVEVMQRCLPSDHPIRTAAEHLLVTIQASAKQVTSSYDTQLIKPSQSLQESSFHDSGIGSSTQPHPGGEPATPEVLDETSIYSTGSSIGLSDEQTSRLQDLFVNRLSSGIRQDLRSDPAPKELKGLLRDFSIIATHAAGPNVHRRKAARFVGRRRNVIANGLDEVAKAESQYDFATHVSSRDRMDRLYFSHPTEDVIASQLDCPTDVLQPADETHEELTRRELSDDVMVDIESETEDPNETLEQEQIRDAQAFLLDGREFKWLVQRVRILVSRAVVGDSYHTIRATIANHLERTVPEAEMKLSLMWNPSAFLERQYEAYEPAKRGISRCLVYCGSIASSFACTVAEYLDDLWPDISGGLLACLQSACLATDQASSVSEIAGASLRVKIQDGVTVISVSGRPQSKLEIAEAFVWLATACRENEGEGDRLAICSPQLDERSLEMKTKYEIPSATSLSDDGVCWLGMVRNPVLAYGYPIPSRDDKPHQKGLEASTGVLVALSCANWGTMYQGKFLFKGLRSALVPVWESPASVAWHFLATEDPDCAMTYHRAHAVRTSVSASSVDMAEMFGTQRRRHFVGTWTPSAYVVAGSGCPGTKLRDVYKLQQSNSHEIKGIKLTPATVTFAGGKFFNAGGSFNLAMKDARLALPKTKDFRVRLDRAEQWKVLFYGVDDRRAWLVDGFSALLHFSIAWLFAKAPERLTDDFKFGLNRCGHPDGKSVLLRNRSLAIYERPEGHKVETVTSRETGQHPDSPFFDSGYGSGNTASSETTREDSKSIISEFTFEELVTDIYQTMELMLAGLSEAAQAIPGISIEKPHTSPSLVGWEIADIIHNRTRMGKYRAPCRVIRMTVS
jgi:tetratricopeptide (TPR) repeat protein